MKQIREPSRTLPVMAETEVLVVGSGPGGLAAALASARQGADTMLVERYGCFGGNITQACVESIAWYRHPQTLEAGGIGQEFEQRAIDMDAAVVCVFAQQATDQRGLASTVRADQCNALAALDTQIDSLQDIASAQAFVQIADLYHGGASVQLLLADHLELEGVGRADIHT